MFSGQEPNGEVELDEDEPLWSMRLYPSNLWTGSNSINDVKRIIHKGRVHVIVCGNGGDSEHCILGFVGAVFFVHLIAPANTSTFFSLCILFSPSRCHVRL